MMLITLTKHFSILVKNLSSVSINLMKMTKLHQFFKSWDKLRLKKLQGQFNMFRRKQLSKE